ncbi:MAG: DUF6179 domain-containing protein [Ruthenibacterium sp.]
MKMKDSTQGELMLSGTQSDALWDSALTDADRYAVQEKLWRLLAEQTRRYTMGESSSVPAEIAQELLDSLLFTLRLVLRESGAAPQTMATADLDEMLTAGQKLLAAKGKAVQRLWQATCLSAPAVKNTAYHDTLKSIGGFSKRYDARFFACRIPCDIDYPLCCAVPQTMRGADYMEEYLRRSLTENRILRWFDAEVLARLLRSCYRDYVGLLVNLCEPVIVNAIGLLLVGGEIAALRITPDEGARLLKKLLPLSREETVRLLEDGARRLCRSVGIEDAFGTAYVAQSAQALYPRLSAALSGGDLSGIFLSF